jgi:hypothetical protein
MALNGQRQVKKKALRRRIQKIISDAAERGCLQVYEEEILYKLWYKDSQALQNVRKNTNFETNLSDEN